VYPEIGCSKLFVLTLSMEPHSPSILLVVIFICMAPEALGIGPPAHRMLAASTTGTAGTGSSLKPAEMGGWSPKVQLERCPRQLLEYVDFHRLTRGTPGAKYMVYSCAEGRCAGLGKGGGLCIVHYLDSTLTQLRPDGAEPLRYV